MTSVRIGTRGSALALWQARHTAAMLAEARPGLSVELVEIVSTGDQITDVPLSAVEGTGFFTATLERALLDGHVDVAVHSFKDLPVAETPGLVVAAVPPRGPVEDVLCAREGATHRTLRRGARVGTCSTRRTAQLRALRPDLEFPMLRGNVPTRVGRVMNGELDAIVLARAGLERLELCSHITEVFPIDTMLPAPAQGALAVQCRASDTETRALLSALDDAPTRTAVTAERTVLRVLGGGCSVPVGASARWGEDGRRLVLTAAVFAMDGRHTVRVQIDGQEGVALGESAARLLVAQGATDLLTACGVAS